MGSRGTGLLGARRVRRWHVHSERPVNEIDITADGGRYTFTRARAQPREKDRRDLHARVRPRVGSNARRRVLCDAKKNFPLI